MPLHDRVMDKLKEALSRDIIEPVTHPSVPISLIVLAFKENDNTRLCVDMRQANRAILRENYPCGTNAIQSAKRHEVKFPRSSNLRRKVHSWILGSCTAYFKETA